MKKLFLIDGTALIFRSFHAFSGKSRLTSKGRDVGMIFGFLSSLFSICRREKPDLLAIAFDTGAPTFRHKMYEAYKANRPPIDPDLKEQIPQLYEMIETLNIPTLSMEGWEADDVIGTLARTGEEKGLEVFMVTGDKDFYQLVTDNVKVYTLPHHGEEATIYDPHGVREKFGVPPEKVIDVLGLMGDSSDNVPGVSKVGPKTAVDLVNRFNDMEGVLASTRKITQPKLRENLETYAEQARLSKKLVIIDRNAPVEADPEAFDFGPLNNPEARQKLADYEFTSILNQLDGLESHQVSSETEESDYVSVTSSSTLDDMIARLNKTGQMLSMDVETTSLDSMQAELVGMSFSVNEHEAYYLSVNYFKGVPEDYKAPEPPVLRPHTSRILAFILDRLKSLYENPDIPKTGQNLKYDMLVLACYDIRVEGLAFDTMIASHLLDPSTRQHNLDILAETHLGFTKIPTTQLIGKGKTQITMDAVSLEEITTYACEDADIALRLTNYFKPRIEEAGLERLMQDQELKLLPVLLDMEKTGVALDTDLLAEMSTEFQSEIDGLELEVYKLAGMQFNLNSTQQLADVLFNKLGLPPGKKTKFGFSTDISELERLAPLDEVPQKLLRYRHLTKLKSTYIDALPRLIHPITGRVHTSYSQTIAATGRLSSTDPNLQNIPIRSEEGGRIRMAFIAGEPGWKIISADYSQIELRIMAHLSGDELLIKAFREGWDIHSSTAAWMHDMPQELVTPDMRRQAKEVNFGVLYGMGEFGLAQRLGISRKRAKEFIDQYFAKFPRVHEYIEEVHEAARKNEYVETMMGRRRPLPEINARNFQVRQNAQRIAINTPIQGSAADLMKLAMIDVHNALPNEGFKARMLLQVHDELVFEAPENEVERLSFRLQEIMGGAMKLEVPLEVGVASGNNWLEAHE